MLKFDKKQLRIFVNRLKGDKLIKQTMRVETQPDGRTNRHNYYFINYKVIASMNIGFLYNAQIRHLQ